MGNSCLERILLKASFVFLPLFHTSEFQMMGDHKTCDDTGWLIEIYHSF